MVNFNRRFWPPDRYMIEAASNGTIGTLRDIHFTLHTNVARWSTVKLHRLLEEKAVCFTIWEARRLI